MSEKPFDYKKEYPKLYSPKVKPELIEVPEMNFVMVDGIGEPNQNPTFEAAIELLYGFSYTIKMSKMKGNQPAGYFEYVVPPLEGLWWIETGEFDFEKRDNWRWTLMIRQPEFVDEVFFNWASEELLRKKPELNHKKARFEAFFEGKCVQMMHLGSYATEPETIKQIQEFIFILDLKEKVGSDGKHHEIYLSDPRKIDPKKMKTVLRHPVV